jgi:hypothetical protein
LVAAVLMERTGLTVVVDVAAVLGGMVFVVLMGVSVGWLKHQEPGQ